ncbi:hypothetical protein [Yoonia sp.]|uniref:hypothetical protein n=1 Tax=Yoonia sp. TaxID=2212373 RepID=UPI0025D72CED|nr:hypothetical protein [Yoonia sp.]
MSARNTVTFYLHPKLRKRAEDGNHNFLAKITDVLTQADLQIAYDNDDRTARLRALARPGRGLYLMQEPVNARGLTMRKTYVYPFWHIEKQAARWDWPVAQEPFNPAAKDIPAAANFYRFWRQRLFEKETNDICRDGFVYVPLQSQLLRKRSFQSCSPIKMIEAVLRYDTTRQVMVTLHPEEVYGAQEQNALEALMVKNDRLFLQVGQMERYLQTCDYVVTQNSSAGFMGYFFGKPLILFAKSDAHHIALNVERIGEKLAFEAVLDHKPDYAGYLHWFLQQRAINAGRPEAKTAIRDVLRDHGWPV